MCVDVRELFAGVLTGLKDTCWLVSVVGQVGFLTPGSIWTLLSPGEMGEELTTIYPLCLSINWAISQAETRSDNASKQTTFLRP